MKQALKTSPNGVAQAAELTSCGHIPALDGLRGLAILLVLVRHFYVEAPMQAAYPTVGPWLTKVALAGNYGVQLFFVLSGFLITGILLDSKRRPGFFRVFYMRRFLRIFPLYYGALCIVFLLLPRWVTFDSAAQGIASRQIWLWTYLSNAPWSGGGWDDSTLFRLGHFWSLCVEEHFYLVWPLLVFLLSPRVLMRFCLACMAACLAFRTIHGVFDAPSLLAWSTVAKLDGLAVGSLLAVAVRQDSLLGWWQRLSHCTLLIAGGLFLVVIFIPRKFEAGWYWGLAETISVCFFGGLLVWALQPGGVFANLMHLRVLCVFGKYSYGLYVIHNLCLPAFERLFKPMLLMQALGSTLIGQLCYSMLAIASSFFLALLSWHLCEKHFLGLKRFFEYRPVTAPKASECVVRERKELNEV